MSCFIIFLVVIIILLIYKIYQKQSFRYCRCSAHMVGKVVIVTGGNSGIGFETAKDLAHRGARVILACRNMSRGNAAKDLIVKETGNSNVTCHQLDLKSLQSVRDFCELINKTEKRLDVLINNAATSGHPNYKSKDGINVGMQVNYFAQFLLTSLLLALLKASAPSRIINVSTMLHKFGEVDFENLNMEKRYSQNLMYWNSKLFLNLMTLELSKKLKGTGVTVNALHPGSANTKIFDKFNPILHIIVTTFIALMMQDVWEASQTSIYLAVAPELKDVSGKYFTNCQVTAPSKLSQDENLAAKLWIESERMVKYTLPEN